GGTPKVPSPGLGLGLGLMAQLCERVLIVFSRMAKPRSSCDSISVLPPVRMQPRRCCLRADEAVSPDRPVDVTRAGVLARRRPTRRRLRESAAPLRAEWCSPGAGGPDREAARTLSGCARGP